MVIQLLIISVTFNKKLKQYLFNNGRLILYLFINKCKVWGGDI